MLRMKTRILKYREQGTEQRAGLDPDGRFVSVGADDYPICNVYGMERPGLHICRLRRGKKILISFMKS